MITDAVYRDFRSRVPPYHDDRPLASDFAKAIAPARTHSQRPGRTPVTASERHQVVTEMVVAVLRARQLALL